MRQSVCGRLRSACLHGECSAAPHSCPPVPLSLVVHRPSPPALPTGRPCPALPTALPCPAHPAALWEAQRQWLQHSLARLALGLAVLLAAASAASNWWGVRALNRQVLPQAQAALQALLLREVQLGAVRWVSPAGLVGLGPLASVGPLSVGPSPLERSSAELQRLSVGLDVLQSALQRRVVLAVKVHGAQVSRRAGREVPAGGMGMVCLRLKAYSSLSKLSACIKVPCQVAA